MSDDLDLDAIRGRVANGIYGYLCLNQDVAALLGLAEAKAPDVEQLIERLRAAALDMFHIHDSPSGRQTDRGMAVYLDAAERIIREWASEQLPAWVPVSERLPTIEDAGRAGCVIGGDGDGVMLCASKHDGTWGWMREESHITHWMPLPAPPQAAGRQG